jgi:hypothetical protein
MRQKKIVSALVIIICLFLILETFLGKSVSLDIKALIAVAVVIILSVFIWYILKSNKRSENRNNKKAKIQKVYDNNIDWLQKRWDRVRKEKASGMLRTVDWWYFDDATDKQLSRIKRMGLNLSAARITEGQASDIIGLYEPAEAKNAAILSNHNIPLNGMNQTRAREIVATLLKDLVETRRGTANIIEHLIIKQLADDFISFVSFFDSRVRHNDTSPKYVPKDDRFRIRYEQAAQLGLASKGAKISIEEKLRNLPLDQLSSLAGGQKFTRKAQAIEILMGISDIVDRFESLAPIEDWFQLKSVKLDVEYLETKWSELNGVGF